MGKEKSRNSEADYMERWSWQIIWYCQPKCDDEERRITKGQRIPYITEGGSHEFVNEWYRQKVFVENCRKIYLTSNSKLNDKPNRDNKLKDYQKRQTQFIHEKISVGHFLDKLRVWVSFIDFGF